MRETRETMIEAAYVAALEAVAMGEDRGIVSDALAERFPLSIAEIETVLADAHRDALRQGIEPEDIDESWRA